MHKSGWKTAFFILFTINLLTFIVLVAMTRPSGAPDVEEKAAKSPGKGSYQVVLDGEALEMLVDKELKEKNDDVRFVLDDEFHFYIPLSFYGIERELAVDAKPYAGEDGYIHMTIERMDLGRIALPEQAVLSLAASVVDDEGIRIDASAREVVLDPESFFTDGIGRLRAEELDTAKDRYIFEGRLEVS
ncbi:MAG: DUF2140 family protein [Peptoniphilus sp.]|nr:DUF2140 family protein [Peptoniphilus sp.]MDY6045171.1 DUF2140 family protein [Peptoniphilus sp.]